MKKMALATYFRTLREKNGLTQPQVVTGIQERLGYAVDLSTVWRWEKEGRRPDGPNLNALLEVLHGDMADIKELEVDPANADRGVRLAEVRFTKWQEGQIQRIVAETPPDELERILAELRREAQSAPNMVSALWSFLAGWRGRADRSH